MQEGSSEKFSSMLLNALSMLRKIQCVRLPRLSSKFDFILITEMWLNNHTVESAIIIPGYKSSRKSRKIQRAGGCLSCAKESIPATLYQDIILPLGLEVTWAMKAFVLDASTAPRFMTKRLFGEKTTSECCCLPTRSQAAR